VSVRYRPMESKDVPACAAIIAGHPVISSRYREAIRYLISAWTELLGTDGIVAAVFEEQEGSTSTLLGSGISAFVTDEFIAELKSKPHFWLGPEIVTRIHEGKSPVLSDKELRAANTVGGLNAAVWHTGVAPDQLARGEVGNTIMTSFAEMHRGFLIKEIVAQAETVEHLHGVRALGMFHWNALTGSYGECDETPSEQILAKPHVVGLTRSLASERRGYWGASTFLYHAPRFGFSRSEQRLLSCGLRGGTDQEIASQLAVSLVSVKKAWRAIYERVGRIAPELVLNSIDGNSVESGERGKAKKQRLLAYVREHPEELRPISRKLLQARESEAGKTRTTPV
jgi:hypothetical protein